MLLLAIFMCHVGYIANSLFSFTGSIRSLITRALRVGGACLMYFHVYVCSLSAYVCFVLHLYLCAFAHFLEAASALFLFRSCTMVHSLAWKHRQSILLLYSPPPFGSFIPFHSLSLAHPHTFRCVCPSYQAAYPQAWRAAAPMPTSTELRLGVFGQLLG